MSAQSSPEMNQAQAGALSDKELNFRKQEEALLKKIEQERQARLAAEAKAAELEKRKVSYDDDDDDQDDPYIDRRKFKKGLQQTKEELKQATQSDIQRAVQQAIYEERRNNWLKSNPDFQDVMQHADKLYQKDPELAETILEMPEGFERQKLVYKNIKALKLHEKEQPKPSIQETIDKNRRSPYYQPSGMGAAPYQSAGDFSSSGQKNAYEKMQQLKNSLRLG